MKPLPDPAEDPSAHQSGTAEALSDKEIETNVEAIQSDQKPIGNGAAITSLIGVTWEGTAPDSIKLSASNFIR